MDPGGVSLLCSHSDKSIRIFDVQSGELLAKGTGHSEVCTGLVLSPSCAQLISVSGDSCMFVWQLPGDLTRAIRRKAAAFARPSAPPLPPSLMPLPPDTSSSAPPLPPSPMPTPPDTSSAAEEMPTAEAPFSFPVPAEVLAEARPAVGECQPGDEADAEDDVSAIDFKMSVSKLPSWARPQGAASAAAGGRGAQRPVVVPGGSRWAQVRCARVDYIFPSSFRFSFVRASFEVLVNFRTAAVSWLVCLIMRSWWQIARSPVERARSFSDSPTAPRDPEPLRGFTDSLLHRGNRILIILQ